MELKSEYTSFEIEGYLHSLNEVLIKKNIVARVKIHRHPEDMSYSIRFTQEILDDSVELVRAEELKEYPLQLNAKLLIEDLLVIMNNSGNQIGFSLEQINYLSKREELANLITCQEFIDVVNLLQNIKCK